MHIQEMNDGRMISQKFSRRERILGAVLVVSGVALAVIVLNPVVGRQYDFWMFTAVLFVGLFLVLPGLFFLLFRNTVVVDPSEKTVTVYRGWIVARPLAEYDFGAVTAVISAMQRRGSRARPFFLWQIIFRVEDGGLVFSAPSPQKEKVVETAEKLAGIIGKPLRHVHEKEDGSGYAEDE